MDEISHYRVTEQRRYKDSANNKAYVGTIGYETLVLPESQISENDFSTVSDVIVSMEGTCDVQYIYRK